MWHYKHFFFNNNKYIWKIYSILIGWEQCNSSVTPVQTLHIVILDYDWLKWRTTGNLLSQWYDVKWWRKFFCGNSEKIFSNEKKMASRKVFQHFLRANLFMFIWLISNHTAVSCSMWNLFALMSFLKAHSCKLIPNWTRKTVWSPIRRFHF